MFVGYQAHGTLGRQILEGQSLVRIHGRQWKVKANIARLDGFSGHADRQALLRWISHLKAAPKQIFLTHGDQQAAEDLGQLIHQQLGWQTTIPEYQQAFVLNEHS